jgi:hypothetical protein
MNTRLDVQQERTEKGDLRYPTRYFGVWRDAPEGPLPYHQDMHTYERLAEALGEALTWARAASGNEACVFNRVTGRLMMRYRQAPSGDLGTVFYSQRGKVVNTCKRQLFSHRVLPDRENITETVTIDREQTSVYLQWGRYAATRRYLLRSLRERGEQVDGQKLTTLRTLLQHYGLDVSDEVAGHPQVNVGTLLFPNESYDAGFLRYLLSCMSQFVYAGSFLIARLGGRQVKISFGWRDYLHIDPTDVQKELDRTAHSLQPCYRALAPEGLFCEVRSMSEFDRAALDIFLWHILFSEGKGACNEALGKDYDLRVSLIQEATDLVVPKLEEEDRLQTMIQLESRFFTDAWTHSPLRRHSLQLT